MSETGINSARRMFRHMINDYTAVLNTTYSLKLSSVICCLLVVVITKFSPEEMPKAYMIRKI